MATRILALVALSALSVSLVACGGGGDSPEPVSYVAVAPAGQLTNVNDSGGVSNVSSMSARLTSLAYTNTTSATVTIRVQTTGSVLVSGASGRVTHAITVNEGAPQSTVIEAVADTSTDAADNREITLPPGQTVAAESRVMFFNPLGSASIGWSEFQTTLTVTP